MPAGAAPPKCTAQRLNKHLGNQIVSVYGKQATQLLSISPAGYDFPPAQKNIRYSEALSGEQIAGGTRRRPRRNCIKRSTTYVQVPVVCAIRSV